MWRCRWISWIWFCVIDLSEDPLLNKDLGYLVVLQLSFRNPLLQELLLSGTHYQTPSPRWLRYHPSEAICLLHHARRRAHSIAEISVRRLAIIIQIQEVLVGKVRERRVNAMTRLLVRPDQTTVLCPINYARHTFSTKAYYKYQSKTEL